MIASPRAPPRSRCADLPASRVRDGEDVLRDEEGEREPDGDPAEQERIHRVHRVVRSQEQSGEHDEPQDREDARPGEPARSSGGCQHHHRSEQGHGQGGHGERRKDRRGVGREDAHPLRLGALGGQDRVQEVDHDVQGEDRDQVSPPLGERGDDEDDEADDPDHERVTQGIEDLSEVDERGRPQVLEPPQDRGLRVRVDDRLMDRDAGGDQPERRPPPRAPPRLSREGGWLARRPAARSSVREPSVGAFGPGHGRCEIPMEAVCRRLDRDRQASGLVDLVTRCDRERIHERPERRGRKACQGSPTAGTRPGRKARSARAQLKPRVRRPYGHDEGHRNGSASWAPPERLRSVWLVPHPGARGRP